MRNQKKIRRLMDDFNFDTNHTKTFDYESMKKRLSNVNKTLYKSELKYDPIALLEKSAITGKIFDKKEPKPREKIKDAINPLSLVLKSEHKNDNKDVKIYQLPKLPFGSHKNYNEDKQFIKNHFKFDSARDELSNNLEVLERKFRLNEKNSSKRGKSQKFKSKNKYSLNSDYFKMDSGFLICKKEKKLIEIYEQNKKKYLNEFEIAELGESEKNYKFALTQNLQNKSIKNNVVERLYPVREDLDSPLSNFYKTKYSELFIEEDNRPTTSFQFSNINFILNK